MPKTKAASTKPVMPVAPVAPVTPEPVANGKSEAVVSNLPVVHAELDIREYSTASQHGPLTVDEMKKFLGWETEKDFQVRMVKEKPGSKPEHWLYGDIYHCLNTEKVKVRTNSNANNRPFDDGWCEHLIQTVLQGQWAGPLTIPGETVNGETVRISKYGRVLSGQHQMTAAVLANERLHKARRQLAGSSNDKYPAWVGHEHVVLETVVITGLSEDPRVLMTIDYVKPRSAADVFYTSEVFKSCSPQERKELCRILAVAVDLLWVRTDAKGYKTHPEVVGFLDRHKTLLKCVEHIFKENSAEAGRKISKYHLSPGHCAAIMYLMGSSGDETDSDEYRNLMPPTEKGLDWSYLDRAEEFWVYFAASQEFLPVRVALGNLISSEPEDEENKGMGGRTAEKLAILAAAWEKFKDYPDTAGAVFTDEDLGDEGCLCLHYSDLDDKGNKLPDGRIKLIELADFYGIDCPQVVQSKAASQAPPDSSPPTKEEIEIGLEEAKQRREAAAQKIMEMRNKSKK